MDKNRLPENIRSIIIAVDDEIKDNFEDINDFIHSIDAILDYYLPIIYFRVTHKESTNDYTQELNDFIDKLTTGIYRRLELNINKEIVYEETISVIAQFIIKYYWKIVIQYADDNQYPIWIFNTAIDDYIYNAKTFKNIIPMLELFNLSVFEVSPIVIDTFINTELTINNKTLIFTNVPKAILNKIKLVLFNIPEYLITEKELIFNLTFKTDTIDLSQGYFNVIYQILFNLLKDKVLEICDLDYWERHYNKIISQRYIADNVSVINYCFYHSRGELNTIEYLMSTVIEYLLEPQKLQINDLLAYQYFKNIFNKDNG